MFRGGNGTGCGALRDLEATVREGGRKTAISAGVDVLCVELV